eukprot:scaffold462_cov195-Pinguiococcus_pyrenoidosus.AAC.29
MKRPRAKLESQLKQVLESPREKDRERETGKREIGERIEAVPASKDRDKKQKRGRMMWYIHRFSLSVSKDQRAGNHSSFSFFSSATKDTIIVVPSWTRYCEWREATVRRFSFMVGSNVTSQNPCDSQQPQQGPCKSEPEIFFTGQVERRIPLLSVGEEEFKRILQLRKKPRRRTKNEKHKQKQKRKLKSKEERRRQRKNRRHRSRSPKWRPPVPAEYLREDLPRSHVLRRKDLKAQVQSSDRAASEKEVRHARGTQTASLEPQVPFVQRPSAAAKSLAALDKHLLRLVTRPPEKASTAAAPFMHRARLLVVRKRHPTGPFVPPRMQGIQAKLLAAATQLEASDSRKATLEIMSGGVGGALRGVLDDLATRNDLHAVLDSRKPEVQRAKQERLLRELQKRAVEARRRREVAAESEAAARLAHWQARLKRSELALKRLLVLRISGAMTARRYASALEAAARHQLRGKKSGAAKEETPLQTELRRIDRKEHMHVLMTACEKFILHRWRLRRRRKASMIIRAFLRPLQDSMVAIRVKMRLFLRRVRECQRIARDYLLCKSTRMTVLLAAWTRKELEMYQDWRKRKNWPLPLLLGLGKRELPMGSIVTILEKWLLQAKARLYRQREAERWSMFVRSDVQEAQQLQEVVTFLHSPSTPPKKKESRLILLVYTPLFAESIMEKLVLLAHLRHQKRRERAKMERAMRLQIFERMNAILKAPYSSQIDLGTVDFMQPPRPRGSDTDPTSASVAGSSRTTRYRRC